ncbi:hypothetical protein PVAP13_5NG140981 [Panicum virgatum]|uniref:Uncharacterized protein n=1 Tax=Panicum virgatum TaxID=38727 RepID=A0A8T0RMT5_PANVG|nr:hypothetical protein PVAP13_5NG140981 [Panicum virgatum]
MEGAHRAGGVRGARGGHGAPVPGLQRERGGELALGPEHPAVRDPDSVHRNSWDQVFELFQLYLAKQNVCINITSFAPTLQEALNHLRQQ